VEQRQLEHLHRHAERGADEVERFVERLRGDVSFIARTPPIQGIRRALASGGMDVAGDSSLDQWKGRLAQIFLAFGAARPDYFELRLIGAADGGRELVRVERTPTGLSVTPPDALQRQGNHYYFREAARLNEGEVYLSRIDLHREHGQIALPHRPTLRAATPVREPDGTLFAIVVLNLDMEPVFDQAAAFHDGTGALYIAGEGGDFLRHPIAGKAFGRELGTPFGLADAFAGQAARIASVTPQSGAFLPVTTSRVDQTVYVTARAWDPGNPARRMLFIITEPTEHLTDQVGLLRRDSLLGMGGLLLLAVVLVLVTVRRETRSLRALAQASGALARGDYLAPLPAADSSEVGSLVRAFRHMTSEVERRESELAELNRELERRVQDRTQALSRQHELQALILESIADGVVVADRQGQFLLWNRNAEQIVGSGPEPVSPDRWASHFGVFRDESGEPLPADELPLLRAIRGEPTVDAELYLRHPSRSEGRWTRVTARPLHDARGETAGAVAVLVDITEEKRLRTRLQGHRAELVRFGRRVLGAEIASSAAHQLSQPIAAISNYAGAAVRLSEQGRLGAAELGNTVERIERLAARCGEILGKLRARIRRRGAPPTTFDVNRVGASCLEFLEDRIAREGVRVEPRYGEGLPPLFGDPMELEHALIQLVSNALEAMEATPRGQRWLGMTTAHDEETEQVLVEVRDTGPGVSEALAERLFEPWETDKPGALGIGLSIAQTIVEGFGGRIRLTPAAGGGAVFRVELPAPGESAS
jgi:PAS domain S-box-containing protein